MFVFPAVKDLRRTRGHESTPTTAVTTHLPQAISSTYRRPCGFTRRPGPPARRLAITRYYLLRISPLITCFSRRKAQTNAFLFLEQWFVRNPRIFLGQLHLALGQNTVHHATTEFTSDSKAYSLVDRPARCSASLPTVTTQILVRRRLTLPWAAFFSSLGHPTIFRDSQHRTEAVRCFRVA